MVTGNSVAIKKIVNENRRTYYRLHPQQNKYPGAIMAMPNLPDDQYHFDLWRKKGYKTTIEELMPGKKYVWDDSPGYGCNRFILDEGETPQIEKPCPKCGQKCVGDFGLQSHMRKHEHEESKPVGG